MQMFQMLKNLSDISADDMESVMSDELMMNSMGPMIALTREYIAGSVGETMNDQEDMSMNTSDEDIMRIFMAPSEPARALAAQGNRELVSPECVGSIIDLIATAVSLMLCAFSLTSVSEVVGRVTAKATARAIASTVLVQIVEFVGVSLAVHVASSAINELSFSGFINAIDDALAWYEWILLGIAFFAEIAAFLVSAGLSTVLKIAAKAATLALAGLTVVEAEDNCSAELEQAIEENIQVWKGSYTTQLRNAEFNTCLSILETGPYLILGYQDCINISNEDQSQIEVNPTWLLGPDGTIRHESNNLCWTRIGVEDDGILYLQDCVGSAAQQFNYFYIRDKQVPDEQLLFPQTIVRGVS